MERRKAQGTRGSFSLAACALSLSLSAVAVAVPQQPESQKQVSLELAELYDSDHEDQDQWEKYSDEEFGARQLARRNRALEIVRAGMLGALEDFYRAGWLLQHGVDSDDFLLAHVLTSVAAFEDVVLARFGSAATLDRFLMESGRAQLFGTQFEGDGRQGVPTEPYDDSLPDSLRELFRCESVKREQAAEASPKKPKKSAAKELAKLLAAARRAPKRGDAPAEAGGAQAAPGEAGERVAAIERAKEIALSGELESKEEYFTAASILAAGEGEGDLLLAHIFALASAFRGHDDGRALAADTLDRMLCAMKRAPIMGTKSDKAGDAVVTGSDMCVHEAVRAAYGLRAAKARKSKD